MIDNNPIYEVEVVLDRTCLVGWQFAADGKWDICERISFQLSVEQNLHLVKNWLEQQESSNIALEALFESGHDEHLFFGVRLTHLTRGVKMRILRQLLTARQKDYSLMHVVDIIRTTLDDPALAGTRPDYLELGVFNLWNRVKSLVVWKKNDNLGAPTRLLLPEEIQDRTQMPDEGFAALHEPQSKPLMLEAAWERDLEVGRNFQCWIGLPVHEVGGVPEKYTISKNRYLTVAASLVGINSL